MQAAAASRRNRATRSLSDLLRTGSVWPWSRPPFGTDQRDEAHRNQLLFIELSASWVREPQQCLIVLVPHGDHEAPAHGELRKEGRWHVRRTRGDRDRIVRS